MTRSLVQALEGISFPCDRERLVEYARTHDAGAKAVAALEEVPEREYRDMTDVLVALPSKKAARRHPGGGEVEGGGKEDSLAAWPDLMAEWWGACIRLWQGYWMPWLR